MKIYVIVLNWNRANDTLECLKSLKDQQGVRFEIVVVDNHSRDDSILQIRSHFPDIILLENKKNLGYSGGMNVGLRFALANDADYVLFMNNDTIALPNMVKFLLEGLNQGADVVAPAIFYARQPDLIWSIGGRINPILLEMTSSHGENVHLPEYPVKRDFVTGCAVMVKSEILRHVGLFDERFFPGYYEDLDFCLRILRKGYTTFVIPYSRLLHKVSQSSGGEASPAVYYLMARNSAVYFKKHMLFFNALFIIPYRLLSALKTSIKLARLRNKQGLIAYWRGMTVGWLGRCKRFDSLYLSRY